MKILLIIFLCLSTISKASNLTFSIGFDLFDSISKNEMLSRKQSVFESPLKSSNRISQGITLKPFTKSEVRFTYKTNSLINFGEMYEIQNGQTISSQIKAQSYIISHPISMTFSSFIVASDITSILHIGNIKPIITNGFMYGFGITYIMRQHHGLSFTYFFPSDTFNTKYSYGLSYSYFFHA